MTGKSRARQLMAQIDALSLRERAMLMLGAFMVLFLLWDWLLMSDIEARSKAISAQIDTTRSGIDQMNQAIAMAAQSRGADPNVVLQEQLAQVRDRIRELDGTLAARAGQVIAPREMAHVLEDMLRRQDKLRLVSLRSLPPESLFAAEQGADELPGSVYRHGLELEVEGRYLDVLGYLRELEALDWQFFWEAFALESREYPANRVRIRIYTLNLEEGWIGA